MTDKAILAKSKAKGFIGWLFAKRSRLILAVLIILAIGVFAWTKRDVAPEVQYQTATVEDGSLITSIAASGTVVSANSFTVKTSASGVVTKVYVEDGDEVVKGQKIAEIELDLDGEQQYAQAYSSYISAKNSVDSANNSLRSAAASLDKVYDDLKGHESDETFAQIETRTKAEVAKDNAVNSVTGAQASLNNASFNLRANSPTILAPNSGTIQGLTIAEGLPLSAQTTTSGARTGQRIATIVTEGNPLISVDLSEIDVPNVEVGQKATVFFDSIPDKTFTGVVTAIDRTGSTTSNVTSYPAIITLDSRSDQILANMAVTANIITSVKNSVLVIPSSAVKSDVEGNYVEVMVSDKPERREVEIGESNDSQTEIISGVNAGDVVVTATIDPNQEVTFGGSGGFGGFGGGAGGFVRR